MIRLMLIVFFVGMTTPALADTGTDWFAAMQKRKTKTAVALTVPGGLKYGNTGKDQVVNAKIGRLYSKAFSKLRRAFKSATLESKTCTQAARELGYMAQEWRDKNTGVGIWIGRINGQFCTGEGLFPPRVWLAQILVKDMPHAIVLYDTGEDKLIDGFYHF
jgi:hypothetical protein